MIQYTAFVKTRNPNNGAQGVTRRAMFARARQRKEQRALLLVCTKVHVRNPVFPLAVTLTRVAPSNGLDPHDGLGAALKGCIDGIADGLGLKNDRDKRVTWILQQRRGPKNFYAVEVQVEKQP